MAAKVANSTQGSTEREQCPGVSYASILNPKSSNEIRTVNKGNNKENIGDQVQSVSINRIASQSLTAKGKSYQRTGRRINSQNKIEKRYGNELPPTAEQSQLFIQKENLVEQEPILENEQLNGDIGSDGEFQTVAPKSARRKEKLREQQRDLFRERQRYRDHRYPLRGHTGSNERSYKERDRGDKGSIDHNMGNKDIQKDKEEAETESEFQPPVKYVEAPLPAVNPWTKSKIVPSTTSSNLVTAISSGNVTSIEKQIEKEKRVLQPQQQQGIIGKCQYTFQIIYFYALLYCIL